MEGKKVVRIFKIMKHAINATTKLYDEHLKYSTQKYIKKNINGAIKRIFAPILKANKKYTIETIQSLYAIDSFLYFARKKPRKNVTIHK
ncbi:hypothetical protein [Paraglaciecola sp.]|uniref:hypothetical protein n=1 Tax=Paraglaciecola sp. TaxID=1920173 RepID=UPI00273E6D5D|nr:hypothetical protein [Paraglaciecola sp.]MDP5030886.1 hypothetical protein [Paraglaciecola sp.]